MTWQERRALKTAQTPFYQRKQLLFLFHFQRQGRHLDQNRGRVFDARMNLTGNKPESRTLIERAAATALGVCLVQTLLLVAKPGIAKATVPADN
jgi:hypothetical protein